MGYQDLINRARNEGERLAKAFTDKFHEGRTSPTKPQLEQLQADWDVYLAAQPVLWTDETIVTNWREAANNQFFAYIKFNSLHRSYGGASMHGQGAEGHDDPRINRERGWGPPSGIARHDSVPLK